MAKLAREGIHIASAEEWADAAAAGVAHAESLQQVLEGSDVVGRRMLNLLTSVLKVPGSSS